jgi:hypothetical protein
MVDTINQHYLGVEFLLVEIQVDILVGFLVEILIILWMFLPLGEEGMFPMGLIILADLPTIRILLRNQPGSIINPTDPPVEGFIILIRVNLSNQIQNSPGVKIDTLMSQNLPGGSIMQDPLVVLNLPEGTIINRMNHLIILTLQEGIIQTLLGVIRTPHGMILDPLEVIRIPHGMILDPLGVIRTPHGMILDPLGVNFQTLVMKMTMYQ